jgi:excinuclease UvrABC nuclease subunit
MSACLYRHFDAKGRLLYVGFSVTVFARTMQHMHGSSWAKLVTRIELEHFDDRNKAWRAEQLAIAKEAPMHNKNFTPKRGVMSVDDIQKRLIRRK